MTVYIEIKKKYDAEIGCYWSLYVETVAGGMLATSADSFSQCWQFLVDEEYI